MEPLIQLTRDKTIVRGSKENLASLRAAFLTQHWLRLPQFASPDILRLIQNGLSDDIFQLRIHEGIARELATGPDAGWSLLTVLFNDLALFETIREITGCQEIQCFTGRIYRMNPGTDHYDAWHDDLGGHRLVAMSLNLAEEPHQGGVLQIRDRGTRQILAEVDNTTYGDAIIFDLSPELQHRVTSVVGAVPRTAFAGWFRSYPSIRQLFTGDHSFADEHGH